MRETDYAREIRTAEDASGQRIERLFIKKNAREEIRFSWWKDGKLMIRPLDLPEDELLPLLQTAISQEIFSEGFIVGLHAALSTYLSRRNYERSVEDLKLGDSRLPEGARETRNLLELLDNLEPLNEEDWPEIVDPPPEPVRL